MTWMNLLGKRCPDDGGELVARAPGFECEHEKCEFFIRAERLEQLLPALRLQYFGAKSANERKHRRQGSLITSAE